MPETYKSSAKFWSESKGTLAIPSYGWLNYLKKMTEFLNVCYSLLQFHEML